MRITDPNLTSQKLYLFNRGEYYHSYRLFGAHRVSGGVRFTLWCPEVQDVSVIGEFNGWQAFPLTPQGSTGVYSGVIPEAREGDLYKYRITTLSGEVFDKADPYAFSAQVRPGTASKIAFLDDYQWGDGRYRAAKKRQKGYSLLPFFRPPVYTEGRMPIIIQESRLKRFSAQARAARSCKSAPRSPRAAPASPPPSNCG